MNILLIWPPDIYGKYGRLGNQWLPTGLGTLASFLRAKRKNVEVRILCVTLERLNLDQVLEVVRSRPWDIIGISYITVQAPYAFVLSSAIRKHSRALLVHGGVHPTISPREVVDYCDVCVLHEGELTFLDIVDSQGQGSLAREKIKGIAFKRGEEMVKTPPRVLIDDLDQIPFPAYDLFPMGRYDGRLHVSNARSLDIMESRGCPYRCSFCLSPNLWQGRVRWHSPQYVVDYLKYAIKHYQINNFHFHGDNFMLRPDWVRTVCRLIGKAEIDVRWCALTRAEHVNAHPELLPLMRKAGCLGIEIGIDSAEAEALRAINKKQNTSEVIKAFKNQQKAGLTPLFTLMGFNPMESIFGYYQQQRQIFRDVLGYHFVHPGQTSTPYLGTDLWQTKEKYGLLLARGWEEYDHKLIPFVPFTLLAGKPERVQPFLRFNEVLIILGTYFTCRVDLFHKYQPLIENIGRAAGYRSKLKKYYWLCEGEYTVRQIAEYLAQSERMQVEESIRFTAFTTLMCAKLGLIRDLSSAEMKDLAIRPLYAGWRQRLLSLWRYLELGLTFHLLGGKEKSKATWQ